MENQISVYYDGLCQVCSREIDHYRRQIGARNLRFVDIFSPDFSAEREGLDPARVHQVMHVRRRDGTLALGVEAFIEIWQNLPRYQKLAFFAKTSFVKGALQIFYQIFTKIRPLLPRKSQASDCETSPYCESKKLENK